MANVAETAEDQLQDVFGAGTTPAEEIKTKAPAHLRIAGCPKTTRTLVCQSDLCRFSVRELDASSNTQRILLESPQEQELQAVMSFPPMASSTQILPGQGISLWASTR